MNEININIEGFNVNGVCVGCLNYNRKMFYSNNVKECFRVLGNIEVPDGLTIQVCWECMEAVRKICKFQTMIQKSYYVLLDYSKKHTFLNSPQDLSVHATPTLTTTVPITEYYISSLEIHPDIKLETVAVDFEDPIEDTKDPNVDDLDYLLSDIKDVPNVTSKKRRRNGVLDKNTVEVEVPQTPADMERLHAEVRDETDVKNEDNIEDFMSDDNSQDYWKDENDQNSDSSDDDVRLSKLKRRKETKSTKSVKKRRIEAKAVKKRKAVPKDKVELITLKEDRLHEIRNQDVTSSDFIKFKYKCIDCITMFNTQKSMELHMEKRHAEDAKKQAKATCPICNSHYLGKDHLNIHKLQHYKAYRCRLCDFETGVRRLVLDHLARQHNENEFKCTLCEETFSSKSKLVYHKGICDQERPQCDCCGKVFANQMTLNYHKKQPSEKAENKPKENLYLPCKGCGKVFQTRKSYRAHVVIHEGLEYPCPVCGKIFQWKRNLARHIRNHSERDTGQFYECKPCKKRFSSKDCYNNHMKFSKKHVSEDNYNHECSYCGKKFPTKWCMVDHVDWDHLKKIKYQCQSCLKPFKTAKILVAHMNNIHSGKKEPEGVHLCDICGKSYTTVKRLKGHVWAMHTHRTKSKSYKCKLCPATFTWQTSIYKHMRMMHGREKVDGKTHAVVTVSVSKKQKAQTPYSGIDMSRIHFFPQDDEVTELIATEIK